MQLIALTPFLLIFEDPGQHIKYKKNGCTQVKTEPEPAAFSFPAII